MTFGKSYRER